MTTQDNNFQLNYLTVQNLKIPDANFISQLWRKNQESSDLFPFGGFGKLKKLKPLNKSAGNICKVILNDDPFFSCRIYQPELMTWHHGNFGSHKLTEDLGSSSKDSFRQLPYPETFNRNRLASFDLAKSPDATPATPTFTATVVPTGNPTDGKERNVAGTPTVLTPPQLSTISILTDAPPSTHATPSSHSLLQTTLTNKQFPTPIGPAVPPEGQQQTVQGDRNDDRKN